MLKNHNICDTQEYGILVDKREIFLHSIFETEDHGLDYKVANIFLKNLRFLENISNKPIIIHQYSIGGDLYDGMLIYDLIKNSSCKIVCVMHGMACSMGSIIPQAAHLRIILPNTLFMTHWGTIDINGLTVKQADAFSDIEKHIRNLMLTIYASRCINGKYFIERGYTEEKIKKFISNKWDKFDNWYLLSDDVVKYGFADGVLGTENYETIEKIKRKL